MAKKKTRRKAANKKVTKKKKSPRRKAKAVKKKQGKFDLDLAAAGSPSIQTGDVGGHGTHSVVISGERHVQHRGHDIQIKTSYEITVDGRPFAGHVNLDVQGRLYTHACPYHEFDSAVEMMKHIINAYPDAFDASDSVHHHGEAQA